VDPQARFTVSRALVMQVTPMGALAATTSVARPHAHLDPDQLLALLAFAGGATLDEAAARAARYGLPPDGVERAAEAHLAAGRLVAVGGDAAPEPSHFTDPYVQLLMLDDAVRLAAYRRALERHARGRRVLDLGAGSGVLSILAARAGASSVTAVEESDIAEMAAAMARANGLHERITVRRCSSRDLVLEPRAELIVHELFGADPLTEAMLPSLVDARQRLLAPGGRLMPARVEIVCAGVAVPHDLRADREAMLELARAFGQREGIAVEPLTARVATRSAASLSRSLTVPGEPLTTPTVIYDLDLALVEADACRGPVRFALTARQSGCLSGVRLWFRAWLDEETVLDTGPDAPPTHWLPRVLTLSRALPLATGDTIELEAATEGWLGQQRIRVDHPA
jgi:hypothetical protein